MIVVRVLAGIAVLGAVISVSSSPVGGAAEEPTIILGSSTAPLGGSVVVTLQGWPSSVVTVGLCGDEARRGTMDCDLRNAQAVAVQEFHQALLELPVVTPPVACPCVVRAATTAEEIVRTTPIEIPGAPVAPLLPAAGPAASDAVRVAARVEARSGGGRAAVAALGGPARRELVIGLRNTTDAPIGPIRVAASLGENGKGHSIEVPVVDELPPQSRRVVRAPLDLPMLGWGEYAVSGVVYGTAEPIPFRTETHTEPWGLEIALPLLLLVAARIARIRARREAARRPAPAQAAHAPQEFEPCSPDVGTAYGERCAPPLYDARSGEVAAPVPNGGHPHNGGPASPSTRRQGVPLG